MSDSGKTRGGGEAANSSYGTHHDINISWSMWDTTSHISRGGENMDDIYGVVDRGLEAAAEQRD
jgi:hypothetical protein